MSKTENEKIEHVPEQVSRRAFRFGWGEIRALLGQVTPASAKRVIRTTLLSPLRLARARVKFAAGVKPLCDFYGHSRDPKGLFGDDAIMRRFARRFLDEHSKDVRGHCLEFYKDQYTTVLGGDAVERIDIIHIDDSNPKATIAADLTKPNTIPSNSFDCIICTFTLHVIFELEKVIGELHRILKPGGVLLIVTPSAAMFHLASGDLWRISPRALRLLLEKAFRKEDITIQGYGNSFAAAAQYRGLVAFELSKSELETYHEGFEVITCARAVKMPVD